MSLERLSGVETAPDSGLPAKPFYVVGGTMPPGARCYVERAADQELLSGLCQGEFCYVLTSRQMGKSSLIARTACRLRELGIAVAVMDLTAIGQNLTVEQWYQGLLGRAARQIGLEEELERFWLQHHALPPLQRFMQALEEIAVGRYQRRTSAPGTEALPSLVVCIDEVDFVGSLPFPTDELFAAIRECYNRRSETPQLHGLTFCILGVASPAELIQDPRSTPFNIGRRIELTDFTEAEVAALAVGLLPEWRGTRGEGVVAAALLRRIHYWTSGQPYLTQRLCRGVHDELAAGGGITPPGPALVDTVCDRIFLGPGSERKDGNLVFVRERVLRGGGDVTAVLELYRRVLTGRRVPIDTANTAQETLRLAGLMRAAGRSGPRAVLRSRARSVEYLTPRNRIYRHVFDARWIRENIPDAEMRRQRAAYRQGLFRAAAVGGVVVSIMVALAAAAVRNERLANGLLQQNEAALRKLRLALQKVEEERRFARREAVRAHHAEAQERVQRGTAEEQRRRAELQSLLAQANGAAAQRERDDSARRLVRLLVDNGERSRREGDLSLALLWFVEALKRDRHDAGREELHRLRIADVLRNCPRLTRSWKQPGQITCAAVSPDGRRIAAGWSSGATGIWNLHTGQRIGKPLQPMGASACLAFSPDGSCLLTGGRDGTVRLWNAGTGLPLPSPPRHASAINQVGFSRDGTRLLAASDEDLQVSWAATGKLVGPPIHPPQGVLDTQLSPDGTRVAAGGLDRSATVWDVETGRACIPPVKHGQTIGRVRFSPDGGLLATASYDHTARIWNAVTGAAVTPPLRHENAAVGLQFSPDGRKLISYSSDRTARLWDSVSGAPGPVLRHAAAVNSAAFSADGARVVTSSEDSTVRTWDAEEGGEVAPPLRHEVAARGAAADQSGRWRLTLGAEGTLRLWDMAGGSESPQIPAAGAFTSRLRSDGLSGFTLREAGIGVLWARSKGPTAEATVELGKYVDYAELSPDGQYLAVGGRAAPQLWHTGTRRKLWSVTSPIAQTLGAAFSPNSRLVAAGDAKGFVHVWDTASGSTPFPPLAHVGRAGSLTFSPDGRRLAVIATTAPSPRMEGRLTVWDLATHRRLALREEGRADLTSAEFSPDGRLLVIASRGSGVGVWEVSSGRQLVRFPHPGVVWHARFSADGARVVTAGEDGMARIWRVNGGMLTPPLKHLRAVVDASFGPDGSLLLTRGGTELQVWDGGTGEAVTEPLVFPRGWERARFTTPRRIAAETVGGAVLRWELPTTHQSANTLVSLAALLSGQRLDRSLNAIPVAPGDIPGLLVQATRAGSDPLNPSPDRAAAWHARELDRCEQSNRWSGVLIQAARYAELRPDEGQPLARRGVAHAQLGDWAAAAADLRQAVRRGVDDRMTWYRLALFQLAAGDRAGYEATAERMLRRFGASADPREPDLAAWTRALGDGPEASARRALALLRSLRGNGTPSASWLGSLGALQVRCGQPAEAVSVLDRAVAAGGGAGSVPDHLFLALAHAQLRHLPDSRQALERARRLMDRAKAQRDDMSLEDRLEQEVLLRETTQALRSLE